MKAKNVRSCTVLLMRLLVPSPGMGGFSWVVAVADGSSRRENATSPATPRTSINKKAFQTECGGIMIGKRETWIFIRLAAIPQPLADDLPLNTVHQAIPKTTAKSVKTAGTSKSRRAYR